MGNSLSSSRKEAKEHQQLTLERAAARKRITDGRALLSKSMQTEHKVQQFYYYGISYYGISMVGFSISMLNLRQRYPALQKVPWIAFTITGYLLGGQIWGLHQKYVHCQSSQLLARLQKKMNDMQEKYPHLSEYRAEVSNLDKMQKDRHVQVTEAQLDYSTARLVLGSLVPSYFTTHEETAHTRHAGETVESMTEDIINQVMQRNKALQK